MENGVINDLNIPNIKGSYDNTMGMKLTLIGPDGTPCLLYANSCNGLVFNFGFDDAVPLLSPCPPADGRLRLPRDTGRLAKFNDKDINGTWTLRLETSSSSGSGGGGSLEEWSIEYCANLTPSSPFFVKNDTLRVPPGQANPVTRTYLEVQDNTSLPEKIEFTLVTLPKNGRLFLVDQELKVGDVFRQSTVNAGNLVYEHDGSSTLADDFTFTISNEEGGWLATPQFNIVIDPDASVGVTDPKWAAEINVFPNPATNELNVDLGFSVNEPVVLSLSNMQGQEMISDKMAAGTRQMQINTSGLASGVYFLSFRTSLGKVTKKVMINR